jgi:hypothetical protein
MPQQLHVADQMVGGIRRKIDGGIARMGAAPSAVALVEQDHPVIARVEEPPEVGRTSGTRTAVHHHRRLAGRIAARLPVDEIALPDIQEAILMWLDFGLPSLE